MDFKYPNFLWAGLVLIIPIVIHLLNLQRSKKVYFTNFQFLKELDQQTKKNFKLKHWLILLSRLFMLLFLVLAFAQPILNSNKTINIVGHKYFFVDNSESMSIGSPGSQPLDRAIDYTKRIVDNEIESSKYFFSNSNLVYNKRSLVSEFNKLKYGYRTKSLDDVNNHISTIEKLDNNKIQTAYILSDFQKSTIGSFEEIIKDSNRNYHVIPLNENKELSNLFIDSVWLDSPFLSTNEVIEVKLRVNNIGAAKRNDVKVSLIAEDELVSTCSSNIEGHSSSICMMNYQNNNSGIVKCTLRIESDIVGFDNEFFFALTFSTDTKALVINDNEVSFIERVLSNEERFNVTSANSNNLNSFNFREYDIVFVESLYSFESLKNQDILRYVEGGGDLVLFPPVAKTSFYTFQGLLSDFGFSVNLTTDTSKYSNGDYLFTPDLSNPFYSGVFFESHSNISMPYFKSKTVITAGSGTILLKCKNGNIALVKNEVGQGACYLWSTPLLDQLTNIHKHSIFLPIIYQSAIRSAKGNNKTFYKLDQKELVISGNFERNDVAYKLKGRDNEIVSNQIDDGKLVFKYNSGDMSPGFYDILRDGELISQVALNRSRDESLTEYYTQEDLQNLFSEATHVNVYNIDSPEQFENLLKENVLGIPLWKKCLLLSLIFLLSEILLIRFYK